MDEAHFYSLGRRIGVFRLRAARVVRLSEPRKVVAVPGWRPFPLGNARFQLLLRADVVPERALRVLRIEQRTGHLVSADEQIGEQPISPEERSLREEVGTTGMPALLVATAD